MYVLRLAATCALFAFFGVAPACGDAEKPQASTDVTDIESQLVRPSQSLATVSAPTPTPVRRRTQGPRNLALHPLIEQEEWERLESLIPEREASARKSLADLLDTSDKDEFIVYKSRLTSLGLTVFKFTLVHDSVPVVGALWSMMYKRDGVLRSTPNRMHFNAHELANVSIIPKLKPEDVRRLLFRKIDGLKQIEDLQMYLYAFRSESSDPTLSLRLDYFAKLRIRSGAVQSRIMAAQVAANTGAILSIHDPIMY